VADPERCRVTLVYLGRSRNFGERRRLEAWSLLLRECGATISALPLLRGGRWRPGVLGPAEIYALVRRHAVLETLAWDVVAARQALRASRPDVAIFVTARACHPGLLGIASSDVLDFVDAMSRSYLDRAKVTSNPVRKLVFRLLAWSHRGFEDQARKSRVGRVAAGRRDADLLEATWIPLVIEAPIPLHAGDPDHDLVFFGSLGYPPNVAAIRRLARLWPALRDRLPGASLLIAGATAPREVRRLVTDNGWDLLEDYADVAAVCGRARLAVIPLTHVAGIQTKVLEAAAAGLAQVISPMVLSGLTPDFPAVVARTDGEFVDSVTHLLGDAAERRRIAEAARWHVSQRYSALAWAGAVRGLIRNPDGVSESKPPRQDRLRISVIIPCHNYGRYLAQSVESVLCQTRPPDEIIIIDDGSNDETPRVVQQLRAAHPELVAERRAPARGTVATMNDGVRWSSGDAIVELSADDVLSDRFLELTERALLADPEADFAYTSMRCFGVRDGWIQAPEWNPRALCQENYVHGTSMFRRSLHQRLGGFRADFNRLGYEDWEFWLHALEREGHGLLVKDCWLNYRRHPQGSRNTRPPGTVLWVHLKVWWLHRGTVHLSDVAAWATRAVMRRGLAGRRAK